MTSIASAALGYALVSFLVGLNCVHDPNGWCGFGYFIGVFPLLSLFEIFLVAFGVTNCISSRRKRDKEKKTEPTSLGYSSLGIYSSKRSVIDRKKLSRRPSAIKEYFKWLVVSFLIVVVLVSIPAFFGSISSPYTAPWIGILIVFILVGSVAILVKIIRN